MKFQSEKNWVQSRVEGFPARWASRLISAHHAKGGAVTRQVVKYERYGVPIEKVWEWQTREQAEAARLANIELCEITEYLEKVRLSPDASDSEICVRAEEFALQTMDCGRLQVPEKVRAGMESFVRLCGLDPPGEKVSFAGAMGRMTCRDWWRRGLRKLHAKAVEGAAIKLGYVNKERDLYVSNESLARRQQQIKRNAAMMENTIMRNELEQEFKLAELAAKGTANKAIRRGELMTRIAGFEKIAIECGHIGLFLTVTCPSRMHKFTAGNGRVFENAKYDGTTPKQAQGYLSKCYARVRAKLARHKAGVYGFRIAEPHHDGCPHWHILLFCAAWAKRRVMRTFRHYFLADSAAEKGASEHRVTCKIMDASKGTAAGYIAKYVAKNIDGLHVENDLYGNPAMETSMRVEAWASTWGIRQFQQVGGAPVGVWRELRRVREVPDGAPVHLKAAHAAVNKIEGEGDGEETKQADWAGYNKAQGGVFCGRGAAIKIATESTGEIGRYGEPVAPRPVGVETVGGEHYRDGIIPDRFRLVHWLVQSVRHVWHVVRGRVLAAVSSPPWTCVNNCTREVGENVGKDGGGFTGGGGVKLRHAAGVCESPGGGGNFASDWFCAGAFG